MITRRSTIEVMDVYPTDLLVRWLTRKWREWRQRRRVGKWERPSSRLEAALMSSRPCPEPGCVLVEGHPGMHEGKDYARTAGIAPSPWIYIGEPGAPPFENGFGNVLPQSYHEPRGASENIE